jgi:hypothetical protein
MYSTDKMMIGKAALLTKNYTWTSLGLNPLRRGKKSASNHLTYGIVQISGHLRY